MFIRLIIEIFINIIFSSRTGEINMPQKEEMHFDEIDIHDLPEIDDDALEEIFEED